MNEIFIYVDIFLWIVIIICFIYLVSSAWWNLIWFVIRDSFEGIFTIVSIGVSRCVRTDNNQDEDTRLNKKAYNNETFIIA